jgi:hypothetical protein
MRSRIELFEPMDETIRRMSADAIRRHWLSAGCVLTAYINGLIRVSVIHNQAQADAGDVRSERIKLGR